MEPARPPRWLYVAAASYLLYLGLVLHTRFLGPTSPGIWPVYRDDHIEVRVVEPASPASRAGLRAGDHILTLDSKVLPSQFHWIAVVAGAEAEHRYAVEIERDGEPAERSLVLPRRGPTDWNAVDFVLSGAKLTTLILAVVIAFSRPRDVAALVGAGFLATVAAHIGSMPPGLGSGWRQLPAPIGILALPAFLSSLFLGALLFSFFTLFPRPLFRERWVWALVWTPALLPMPAIASVTYRLLYQPETWPDLPQGWLVFVAYSFPIYLVGGLAVLIFNYRQLVDANEKRRVRVLVAGSTVAWLAVLPLAVFYDSPGTVARYASVTELPTVLLFLVFPLSFTYAILRHRIFDIHLVVRQGIRYALARRALLSVLPALAAIFVIDLWLHRQEPLVSILRERVWVYLALAGLWLVTYRHQQNWLDALDRRFFRERYSSQQLLLEIVQQTHRAEGREGAGLRIVAAVEAALHPEFAALLVRAGDGTYQSVVASPAGRAPAALPTNSKLIQLLNVLEKPMEVGPHDPLTRKLESEDLAFLRETGTELLVPVFWRGELRALLACGLKRSEEPYSREDQELLEVVATSFPLVFETDLPQAVDTETPTAEKPLDAFGECPLCGRCYEATSLRCEVEGTSLTIVPLCLVFASRYKLQRRVGRGGMGTVYEANDEALSRSVAIKLVREDESRNALARFRREARITASFTHPNVVTVFDFGIEPVPYLVMELLRGRTLRDELAEHGRLDALRVRQILPGLCSALDAAHRRNLIHRDLKPANVFLAVHEDGETLKVLDFGLARILAGSDDALGTETKRRVIVGTPPYIAPEILRGEDPSPACDLWSLAVITYELLTGTSRSRTTDSSDSSHFSPASIGSHLKTAPASWQHFFKRALSAAPEERPRSAKAFLDDVYRMLED